MDTSSSAPSGLPSPDNEPEPFALLDFHFRLLAEHAGDFISLLDAADRFVYVNPAHADALGFAPAELLGKSLPSLLHPDENPAAVLTGEQAEFRMIRRDGTTLWWEGAKFPLPEVDGLLL